MVTLLGNEAVQPSSLQSVHAFVPPKLFHLDALIGEERDRAIVLRYGDHDHQTVANVVEIVGQVCLFELIGDRKTITVQDVSIAVRIDSIQGPREFAGLIDRPVASMPSMTNQCFALRRRGASGSSR